MSNEIKEMLEFGPFRVDPRERLLLRDQQPVSLSPKDFDLLLLLLERSGRLVLKDELMQALWPDTFVEESNLGQHIFQLRKALGDRAQDSPYIVTVPGQGYRFARPVRALTNRAKQVGEDVVVEAHSRQRVVVGESDVEGEEDRELASFLLREPRRLPGASAGVGWSRRKIATMIFAAATTGMLAVWFFLRPAPVPLVVRAVRLTQNGRAEPGGRVLTDGHRLYFTERLGGTLRLAQIPEEGGEPQLISASVSNIALYDIDLSGSRLLVGAQEPGENHYPLWIVGTTGGSGQRVADALAGDAAWAPDGYTLAYSDRGDLYLTSLGDQPPRKLFSSPGTILSITWSPDAQRLSLTVRGDRGVVSLWELARDGSNPHQVFLGWKNPPTAWGQGESGGVWSPDGNYFLFRSVRGSVQSLWMRKRTSWFHRNPNPVQIYTSPDWIGQPRFSLDGKRIFFSDCHGCGRELLRYDSTRNLFVPYLGGIAARHLSFSHDGQWVAYESEVDNTLWRSRIDGSQALQLTFPPLSVLHSTWSPDGRQIIFDADGMLRLISTDGGTPVSLVPGSQPSWSPDGSSVLLVQSVQDANGWHAAIFQLDWNTRKATMLPGSLDCEGPQWSPDGKYAAAADRRDKKLILFDFAHRQWSALADGVPYGWGIRWSMDSKYVYYQHNYGDEQPIFRVRLRDHQVDQITSSRQILRADLLSYTMTGLTPDNSPLASLVRRGSDIYSLQLELP